MSEELPATFPECKGCYWPGNCPCYDTQCTGIADVDYGMEIRCSLMHEHEGGHAA